MGLLKSGFLQPFCLISFLPSCISTNNQECRIGPQIVNINCKESIFFPFSIKTSECSGSCNNINNSHAKLCVPDIVKNLNVKSI